MPRNKSYNFLALLQEHSAFLEGHFVLGGGLHSGVYIKAVEMMKHPHIAKKAGREMSALFSAAADIVLAPSKAAFCIARAVAEERDARAVYGALNDAGNFEFANNVVIKPSETVLIADDVAVSGRQISRALAAVKKTGAKVIGICVLVDRSGGELALSAPLRALLSYPLVTYTEAECPLCKKNIPLEKNND